MYGDWCTMAWINGQKSFLDAAEAHKSAKDFMRYPCRLYQNKKEYSKRNTLHAHIYEKDFMDNYTLWTKHGEPRVLMEDDEGNYNNNNIADWAHLYEVGAFENEPMDGTEEMDEAEENAAEDQPHDELG